VSAANHITVKEVCEIENKYVCIKLKLILSLVFYIHDILPFVLEKSQWHERFNCTYTNRYTTY